MLGALCYTIFVTDERAFLPGTLDTTWEGPVQAAEYEELFVAPCGDHAQSEWVIDHLSWDVYATGNDDITYSVNNGEGFVGLDAWRREHVPEEFTSPSSHSASEVNVQTYIHTRPCRGARNWLDLVTLFNLLPREATATWKTAHRWYFHGDHIGKAIGNTWHARCLLEARSEDRPQRITGLPRLCGWGRHALPTDVFHGNARSCHDIGAVIMPS